MIEVFYAATPNGLKVTLALEEMELPYRVTPIDIFKGEQFDPAFLKISPNNRIPAIIDHAPADGGPPLSLFESGAILLYLADKTQRFLPASARARAETIQWLMWQKAGFGPMIGQAHHFFHSAPEAVPYAVHRYAAETARLYSVLDRRLGEARYVGGEYSVADMACWPWVFFRAYHRLDLRDYPRVERWFDDIAARPAVVRAFAEVATPAPSPLKPGVESALSAEAAA